MTMLEKGVGRVTTETETNEESTLPLRDMTEVPTTSVETPEEDERLDLLRSEAVLTKFLMPPTRAVLAELVVRARTVIDAIVLTTNTERTQVVPMFRTKVRSVGMLNTSRRDMEARTTRRNVGVRSTTERREEPTRERTMTQEAGTRTVISTEVDVAPIAVV